MDRRTFLGSLAAAIAPPSQSAARQPYGTFPLPLWLKRGNDQYYFDAATSAGYEAARWLLRDVVSGAVGYPSMDALHMLSWLNMWLAGHWSFRPIIAHSGLRLASTNALLENAVQNSLHLPDGRMVFRAVDCHIEGIPTRTLGDLAYAPAAGGVGVYPAHIHVDDGAVRRWEKNTRKMP